MNAVSCVLDAFYTHKMPLSCIFSLISFYSLSCSAWSVYRPAAHLKLKHLAVCVFYLIIMCVSRRNVYNTAYSLSHDQLSSFGWAICCFSLSPHSHTLRLSRRVRLTRLCTLRSANARCPWSPLMASASYTLNTVERRRRQLCGRKSERYCSRWRPFCLACVPLHRFQPSCRQIIFVLWCFVALRCVRLQAM